MRSILQILSIVILGIMILSFPGFLSAQLYKYYNQEGILCFTDDYSMVPLNQRSGVQIIYQIQPLPTVSIAPDKDTPDKSISGQTIHSEAGLKAELDLESKQLGSIKKELDNEYSPLKERRDILILNKKTKRNANERKAYNQTVKELNQELLTYKEKMGIYLKRVEAYNLKLKNMKRSTTPEIETQL